MFFFFFFFLLKRFFLFSWKSIAINFDTNFSCSGQQSDNQNGLDGRFIRRKKNFVKNVIFSLPIHPFCFFLHSENRTEEIGGEAPMRNNSARHNREDDRSTSEQ